MESVYKARVHHVIRFDGKGVCLDSNILESFVYVLLGGDNIEGFKEITQKVTNHTDCVVGDLTYQEDTVGPNNKKLGLMAEGLRNLTEIIYLAPNETLLELSAFPTADPICLAICIGKHCQIGLSELHRVNPQVEDPKDNHDVKIMLSLLKCCENMFIPVQVTQWQYFDGMAYPVRVQIRVGDLRRVVGIEV